VVLSVNAEDLDELTPPPTRSRESPLEARLRRAWDWLAGVR